MDSTGGITVQCCGVIKSLSGGRMSEGFTAGCSTPQPESPTPPGEVLFCFFLPSTSWPHFMMLNEFQVQKPFNLALFFFLSFFLVVISV